MSRVGKMPIALPNGVDVAVTAGQISVRGALGTLVRPVNALVTVSHAEGKLSFVPANESVAADAMSGTMRALVANMWASETICAGSTPQRPPAISGVKASTASTSTSKPSTCITQLAWQKRQNVRLVSLPIALSLQSESTKLRPAAIKRDCHFWW